MLRLWEIMSGHHNQGVEVMKAGVDILSISVVIAALASWLPPVAALLTVVWTLIRIWESRTVQGWRGRDGASDD